MAVRMSALVQSKKSGGYIARKVIPKDVQEAYARLYGVRWEEQLKLPAGTSLHEAKKQHCEWLAEIETRIQGRPLRTLRNALEACQQTKHRHPVDQQAPL